MFSNKYCLQKKTPKNVADRKEYLKQLVEEFTQTNSLDSKRQVLANLSNFAYDPINYEYLRLSGALDLFIQLLDSAEHQDLKSFATAGICNLCLDPINAKYIVQQGGLQHLIDLLSANHDNIILNCITSLLYISQVDYQETLKSQQVYKVVVTLSQSENTRIKNLATLFLSDLFGNVNVDDLKIKTVVESDYKLNDIPLP